MPEGDANPGSLHARAVRASRIRELEALVLRLEGQLAERDAGLAAAIAAVRAEYGQRDERGGVVDAARMRQVLAQPPSLDVGATDEALRAWLVKDPKGYFGELDDRERKDSGVLGLAEENKRLRARVAELEEEKAVASGPDLGSAKAEKLLTDFFKNWKGAA